MTEKNELVTIANELMSLGIEELESRQEMALINTLDVDGSANSKCTENNNCNTVKGCGVSSVDGTFTSIDGTSTTVDGTATGTASTLKN